MKCAATKQTYVSKKIGPPQNRSQISGGGAPTSPAVYRHIHRANPFLLEAIHIGCERVAGLYTRLYERSN